MSTRALTLTMDGLLSPFKGRPSGGMCLPDSPCWFLCYYLFGVLFQFFLFFLPFLFI